MSLPSNSASLHQLCSAFLTGNKFCKVSCGILAEICLSISAGPWQIFAVLSAMAQLPLPQTLPAPPLWDPSGSTDQNQVVGLQPCAKMRIFPLHLPRGVFPGQRQTHGANSNISQARSDQKIFKESLSQTSLPVLSPASPLAPL